MRILVLGGTRFLGLRLVMALHAAGHALTVLSRRGGRLPEAIRCITGERDEGLARLAGERFDLAIDFIAYRGEDTVAIANRLDVERYLLISTTWLPRLWGGRSPLEVFAGDAGACVPALPPVTQRYLRGKLDAERALATLRAAGREALSLRLPIMLGTGDHTGRLDFYRARIADGGPLIRVDGGRNLAQIAWIEDLAALIADWIGAGICGRHPVWEALPDAGVAVREILAEIAAALGRPLVAVDRSAAELAQALPAYLEAEPLWRETPMPASPANLFAALGRQPTPRARWLAGLPAPAPASALRGDERTFLAGSHVD